MILNVGNPRKRERDSGLCRKDASCKKSRLQDANVQFNRISIDPNICHGQARVKTTHIPVHQIGQAKADRGGRAIQLALTINF
jgi:Protein of unknown function (DUF433)